MRARVSTRSIMALAVAAALLVPTAGCGAFSSAGSSADTASTSGAAPELATKESAAPADAGGAQAVPQAGTEAVSRDAAAQAASTDRLVITNAAMSVEVEEVASAVDKMRDLIAKSGGQVTELSIQSGDGGPVPLAEGGTSPAERTPTSAILTLRVPAEKLAEVQTQAAKLGAVLSQSASESDVTQQHVDLTARLANLRAEEARLREFLDKAKTVSEMLEVERELSRVRGEIESMQAQVDYLERQAAMATLTLSLYAPGAIVRPDGNGWGFADAVTRGFQAAAALLGVLITVLIALAPLAAIVLFVVFVWRAALRRRRARRAEQTETGMPAASTDDDAPTPDTGNDDSEQV